MHYDLVQISKTMSHALRHAPKRYGLQLDEQGWVRVEEMLVALRKHRRQWQDIQEEDLVAVIAGIEKQRFEMRDGRIRALYGHSTAEKIVKLPETPPEVLYHGTTSRAAMQIRQQGLKPMGRQYVHLSADLETARVVAVRRTATPVILTIRARQASEDGISFYLGNDNVWLADPIPASYIQS